MTNNQHPTSRSSVKPQEAILVSTPIGLADLGAKFKVEAPWSACRLCGAIYQSELDRLSYDMLQDGRITEHIDPYTNESIFIGDASAANLLDDATDRRRRWRELHERRYHTEEEIELLLQTGFAMTPQAAHRLAPFGITPLGNMHEEIVDALYTAPRAPIDDAEG
jgi:hypothetical protein